jgi:hypothetical protein
LIIIKRVTGKEIVGAAEAVSLVAVEVKVLIVHKIIERKLIRRASTTESNTGIQREKRKCENVHSLPFCCSVNNYTES